MFLSIKYNYYFRSLCRNVPGNNGLWNVRVILIIADCETRKTTKTLYRQYCVYTGRLKNDDESSFVYFLTTPKYQLSIFLKFRTCLKATEEDLSFTYPPREIARKNVCLVLSIFFSLALLTDSWIISAHAFLPSDRRRSLRP